MEIGLDQVIMVAVALAGFLFGAYKWKVARNDKQKSELTDTKNELRDAERQANKKVLDEHADRLDHHAKQLRELKELFESTRAEMRVNNDKLGRLENLEATIDDKLSAMFNRINEMDANLNQAIGVMRANHESEIKGLIKEISQALNNGQPQK